jgi:uncharacterized protein YjdB
MKRLVFVVVTLATLGALACTDSATDPGGTLRLALSLNAAAGGSDAAFDKADQLAIRLLDGNDVVFEQDYAFSSSGGDVTIDAPIDRSLAGRVLTLEAFLRWQSQDLFQGSGRVTPRAGGAEVVSITLVPIPAALLIEEPSTLTEFGATLQLHAAAILATGDTARDLTVTWSLLDPDVITLSTGGVATAKADGTARVEAHAGALTAQATVEVRRAVASIGLSTNALSLGVGVARPVEAFVLASNGDELSGRTVSWTSDDPTVADVAPQGPGPVVTADGVVAVVTGRSPGSTTIRAASEGREGTVSVTVVNTPVALVPISPLRTSIVVGGTTTFTAMPEDDAGNPLPGRAINWSSSDPSIAEVSGSGATVTVTGRAPGFTALIATSEGRTGLVTVGVAASGPVPLAWARAHKPGSTIEYAPEGVNLAGGGMAVGTEAQGLYFLDFDNLGIGALGTHFTAYVTAESSGGLAGLGRPEASCYVYDVYTDVPFGLGVECVDAASRNPVDVPFTAVVVGDGALGGAGAPGQRSWFSLHSNPLKNGVPYTPLPDFSWNSAGAPMTVVPTTSGVVHRPGVTMRPPFATFVARIGQPGVDDCLIQSVAATEVDVGCYGISGTQVDLYHFVMGLERGRPGTEWGLVNVDPSCPLSGPASTTVELDALDPAAAGVLTSVASTTEAEVEFVNDACEDVQIYWIDYTGARQDYGTLAPGKSYIQGTFVTHPWYVIGRRSGALAVFQPMPGRAVARIRPMSSSTGPVDVTRIAAGKYRVVFEGSTGTGPPAVLVSPMGSGFASCSQRVTAFAPVTVEVGCWGASGQFQDLRFSLAYLR